MGSPKNRVFTPGRVLVLLAMIVLIFAGSILVLWLTGPQDLTLEITEPVGKTVVTHLIVAGRAESREDTAPVSYRFELEDLQFAVICLDDSPPNDVHVVFRCPMGGGGSLTSAGVIGRYSEKSWLRSSHLDPMTAVHVASMRKAVVVSKEEAEEAAKESTEKADSAE